MAALIAVGAVAGCKTAATAPTNTQAPVAVAPSNTQAPTMPATPSANPTSQNVRNVVFKTEENHQTLTAPMNTPLSITFNPSKMGCSSKIAFTSGSFTKTSAAKENVTYSTDGLPAGTYDWKCSMEKCCYGKLVVEG